MLCLQLFPLFHFYTVYAFTFPSSVSTKLCYYYLSLKGTQLWAFLSFLLYLCFYFLLWVIFFLRFIWVYSVFFLTLWDGCLIVLIFSLPSFLMWILEVRKFHLSMALALHPTNHIYSFSCHSILIILNLFSF